MSESDDIESLSPRVLAERAMAKINEVIGYQETMSETDKIDNLTIAVEYLCASVFKLDE